MNGHQEKSFFGFPIQEDDEKNQEILKAMRYISNVVVLAHYYAFTNATKEQAALVAKKVGVTAIELHSSRQ